MAGKDKLMRGTRVYVGGYDLSGDVRTLGSLDYTAPEVDMTGLSNDCDNFLAGRFNVGVRGFQSHLNDASGGASAVMQSAPNSFVSSVLIGSGGSAPAAGDLAYIIPGVQLSDTTEFSSSTGMFSTDMLLDTSTVDANYKTPIGKVLFAHTSYSSTTNGSTVDIGAAGSNGGHGSLHITNSGGGSFAFIIQHSTTGAWAGEESTLLTFSSDGSAVAGEWKSVSGTVRRYIRGVATRTAGLVVMTMAFSVNK